MLVAGAALLGLLIAPSVRDPAAAASPAFSSPRARPPAEAHAADPITPPPGPATAPASWFAQALALADRGRFPEAALVAQKIPADQRAPALASVFSRWAQQHPAAAANQALALATDADRNLAWHAVATVWAGDAPADLAAFAWSLSEDAARAAALDAALPVWLERDETAALAWIGALPAAQRTDSAVAIVARHPQLIERDPELALSWAEIIRDPALRSRTLGQIVRAWLPANPQAAALYARTAPGLSPSEREDILVGERFTTHP